MADPARQGEGKRIEGNRENDVQSQFFYTGQASRPFIEPAREIPVKTSNTREDPQEDYERRKGEIHPARLRLPAA